MTARGSHKGFTLVELMIVIAIIAILSAIMVGLNSQTYGASSMNTADELVASLQLCKMRAVSTRRYHRCEISAPAVPGSTSQTLTIAQWSSTGMLKPPTGSIAATSSGSGSGTSTWQLVQTVTVGVGIGVWDASATACAVSPCSDAPTAPNSALLFDIDFRPDGSSTGGTLYVSDPAKNKVYRVVVYTATGSSYARNSW
jgi:prepilin-type N-terminal cleavage/methylation domain-containing protein